MPDKQWATKNPEKHAAKSQRWREANPEKTRAARQRWREAHPERHRQIQRESAARNRQALLDEMLAAYGSACSCCGEDDRLFLSLEHVEGLRGQKRPALTSELRRLRREDWPGTCTVLCFNCNLGSARNGGVCPHKILVDDAVSHG